MPVGYADIGNKNCPPSEDEESKRKPNDPKDSGHDQKYSRPLTSL